MWAAVSLLLTKQYSAPLEFQHYRKGVQWAVLAFPYPLKPHDTASLTDSKWASKSTLQTEWDSCFLGMKVGEGTQQSAWGGSMMPQLCVVMCMFQGIFYRLCCNVSYMLVCRIVFSCCHEVSYSWVTLCVYLQIPVSVKLKNASKDLWEEMILILSSSIRM